MSLLTLISRFAVPGVLASAGIALAPTAASHALVNRVAISCMHGVVRSQAMQAAWTAQAGTHGKACATGSLPFDATSEAAVRWTAVSDIVVGNYALARNRLVRAPRVATKEPLRRFFVGLTAHALGRSDEAIGEWEALDPTGRLLEVVAVRIESLGRADAALSYSYAFVARHSNSAAARFRLAEALYRAGKLDAALDQYRRGFSSPSQADAAVAGEAAYHEAQILSARHEYEEAIAALKTAVAVRPGYPIYTGLLASVYAESGDLASAVYWLDETVKSAPDSAYPYWEYGRYYMSRQMADRAVAQFERAVHIEPMAPAFYFGDLGSAYFAAGKLPQALDAWREARRRAADNRTYLQWLTATEAAAQQK